MGRSVRGVASAVIVLFLAAGFTGCSSSSPTNNATFPVPAIVNLSPATTASLEVGKTLAFTGTPENKTGSSISEPVFYQSSNTAVLTIASNGLACAGSWNSLTSPAICTPGPPGVAQVTATAKGVSSPTTTVYVHQHIDSISVNRITDSTTPDNPCISLGQLATYQATAFNRGVDITSTVGTFSWLSTSATVVSLTTSTPAKPVTGLQPGQVQAAAKVPGTASIFATISGTASVPVTFTVCPVQSITLEVNGTSETSLTVPKGTSTTIKPTIVDTLGNTITGSFLTWSSSASAAVSVNSTGTATTPLSGGASITASCTPPTCNIGILPTLPIYANSDVYIKVGPSGTTTNPTSTVWATTTGCGATDGCVTNLVPIILPNFTTGNPIALPATPNSFVFTHNGGRAFLGTDSGDFGTKGLMVLAPGTSSSVSEFVAAPGKVLAVSNDGTKVAISDTVDTPNQVYIFNCGGSTGACSSPTVAALNISGAAAAAFSPDGLKAFIVANNGSSSTLYVYSTLDSLKTIPLSAAATANDVAFLGNGAFGYIAGGTASGVSVVATCFNPASPAVSTVSTPGTPLMIRILPDGNMLALDPPGVDFISSTVSGTGCAYSRPYPGTSGAPFIQGTLSVSNTVSSVNLGQGAFTPSQFIVSGDASTAYLILKTSPTVVLFNIPNRLTSGIQLAGNATPLSASLTVDGTQLYIGASDGTVHVLDTVLGNDMHQVSFPTSLCDKISTPCVPDLVAATP